MTGRQKDRPMTQKRPKQRKTPGHSLWEWAKSIAIALVIWLFVRSLLVESFRIISPSLEPTLHVGDVLFVNKALYGAHIPLTHVRMPAVREPQPSDLVMFKGVEEPVLNIVKRLIGTAGDTLQMRNDSVFRNNAYVPEPHVRHVDPSARMDDPQRLASRRWQLPHLVDTVATHDYLPDLRNWGPLVVPPGHVFVMGDNRDNSYDGRYWGFLPRGNITGHPMLIYFSYDPDHWRPLPILTAIRWRRLFHRPS